MAEEFLLTLFRAVSMNNVKGFSLIEIIVFIVVFTIGVIGLMTLFYNTMGKTSDPMIRLKGIQVAQAVMDEILTRKWDELTPNGGGQIVFTNSSIGGDGESFADYDDVDDYNGLNCMSGTSGCFNLDKNYRITVNVEYGKLNGTDMVKNGSNKSDYKIIEVVVSSILIDEKYRVVAVKGNF